MTVPSCTCEPFIINGVRIHCDHCALRQGGAQMSPTLELLLQTLPFVIGPTFVITRRDWLPEPSLN